MRSADIPEAKSPHPKRELGFMRVGIIPDDFNGFANDEVEEMCYGSKDNPIRHAVHNR